MVRPTLPGKRKSGRGRTDGVEGSGQPGASCAATGTARQAAATTAADTSLGISLVRCDVIAILPFPSLRHIDGRRRPAAIDDRLVRPIGPDVQREIAFGRRQPVALLP